MGAIWHLRNIWPGVEIYLVFTTGRKGLCSWCLVSKGQGCCLMHRPAPQERNIHPQMSTMWRIRNSALISLTFRPPDPTTAWGKWGTMERKCNTFFPAGVPGGWYLKQRERGSKRKTASFQNQVDCGERRKTGHRKAGSPVFASISLFGQIFPKQCVCVEGGVGGAGGLGGAVGQLRGTATQIRICCNISKDLGRAGAGVHCAEFRWLSKRERGEKGAKRNRKEGREKGGKKRRVDRGRRMKWESHNRRIILIIINY